MLNKRAITGMRALLHNTPLLTCSLQREIKKIDTRATDGTGVGLGMKAPIEWVVVLRLAGWTQWKDTHGCLVTIVGYILNNGEARAAVGAIDERVAVAPVSRIEEFMQTISTGGSIRRDERVAICTRLASGNHKDGIMEGRHLFGDNRIDTCQGRSFFAQSTLKSIERLMGTLDLNGHT